MLADSMAFSCFLQDSPIAQGTILHTILHLLKFVTRVQNITTTSLNSSSTHLMLKQTLTNYLQARCDPGLNVSDSLLTFRPRREPASLGMADLLLSVMRPIRWSPSLDGCHVTGCYRKSCEGSYEAL